MHQVYDDEMTFKLVKAASDVSGLPVEVCLEEFGKHFLVYCQKNGYDQILRVLGSNLYDFLTNLDNLHDHLASIYPGMRAPSFRVTRFINTNQQKRLEELERQRQSKQLTTTTTTKSTIGDLSTKDSSAAMKSTQSDEQHKQNAACKSLAGSMYLHYYSDRKGLSPIVKGLVMAVAREFFQTEIIVSEISPASIREAKRRRHSADCGGGQESCSSSSEDDEGIAEKQRDPGEEDDEDLSFHEEENEGEEEVVEEDFNDADHVVLKIDRRVSNESAGAASAVNKQQEDPNSQKHLHEQGQEQQEQTAINDNKLDNKLALKQNKQQMLTIYDSLSTNQRDSLVSSEIMMQTFPFHVIFDREFNIVQVGKSLLKVTGQYWRQRQLAMDSGVDKSLVKFGDLFQIIRPKIEFSFEAIADHTNQVFVVRTRPLILNADLRNTSSSQKRASSGSSSSSSHCSSSISAHQRPMCPFDKLAIERRRSNLAQIESLSEGQTNNDFNLNNNELKDLEDSTLKVEDHHHYQNPNPNPNINLVDDEASGMISESVISLRLKGQMIILMAGEMCLFLCSPRVDHLNQLDECGVKMSNFALHDRSRELMLMSHTHKEDREAVKKLDQASNDLKKMDTKLRQENKRTNEVLHNIFPAKIASLLSHGLKVESESFDLVTCLYSDIIGFTKMCGSENVKPIDIVRLLNTLYLQFDNLTTIHEVFKVETIGDAYVVVGGLPEPAEDHADRCVKMGLDMVKVIATVRSPADKQPIQMRIGIHSGPVMAGIVGIRVPRYSLFGNTTTLANQLETHGVGGKIHISDFTLRNLIKREKFVVEDNPNQIGSLPFVTYFVTDYLKDENETIEHKKILEEQLLKDLELMGNEVELVDDSHYQNQLYACSLPASGVALSSAPAASNFQPTSNALLATDLTQAAPSSPSNLIEQPIIRPSIEEIISRNNLRELDINKSGRQIGCPISSSSASCQRLHDINNSRPLTESIIRGDKELANSIIMDIEANELMSNSKMTTAANSLTQSGDKISLLRQMSNHITSSIILDAIKGSNKVNNGNEINSTTNFGELHLLEIKRLLGDETGSFEVTLKKPTDCQLVSLLYSQSQDCIHCQQKAPTSTSIASMLQSTTTTTTTTTYGQRPHIRAVGHLENEREEDTRTTNDKRFVEGTKTTSSETRDSHPIKFTAKGQSREVSLFEWLSSELETLILKQPQQPSIASKNKDEARSRTKSTTSSVSLMQTTTAARLRGDSHARGQREQLTKLRQNKWPEPPSISSPDSVEDGEDEEPPSSFSTANSTGADGDEDNERQRDRFISRQATTATNLNQQQQLNSSSEHVKTRDADADENPEEDQPANLSCSSPSAHGQYCTPTHPELSSRRRLSIEQSLNQMRGQVRSLEEMLKRLELVATVGGDLDPTISNVDSSQEVQQHQKQHVQQQSRKSASLSGSGRSRRTSKPTEKNGENHRVCVKQELSSKMQRMKRMDTLKRRKMEKLSDSSSRGPDTEDGGIEEDSNGAFSPGSMPTGSLFARCQQSRSSGGTMKHQASLEPFNECEEQSDDNITELCDDDNSNSILTKPPDGPKSWASMEPEVANESPRRKSYQNIRNSLANIMTGVTNQVVVQKRFALNSFVGLFNTTQNLTNNIDKSSATKETTSKFVQQERQSARLPSKESRKLRKNCGCLRSSDSNQSFETGTQLGK